MDPEDWPDMTHMVCPARAAHAVPGPALQVELVPLQTSNCVETLGQLRQECIPKDTSLFG